MTGDMGSLISPIRQEKGNVAKLFEQGDYEISITSSNAVLVLDIYCILMNYAPDSWTAKDFFLAGSRRP